MKYSPLVYAQATEGQPYTRPAIPGTFINLFASTPTWDPYSANAVDRTEYWEDTAGTLDLDQVQLAIYGLEGIRDQQIAILTQNYLATVDQNVVYTTTGGLLGIGSVTATFQADTDSMKALLYTIAGCSKNQATPPGFKWQDMNNDQHPFTFADLYGLADAMFVKGGPAFFHLQAKKTLVRAATTVLEIQAIVW